MKHAKISLAIISILFSTNGCKLNSGSNTDLKGFSSAELTARNQQAMRPAYSRLYDETVTGNKIRREVNVAIYIWNAGEGPERKSGAGLGLLDEPEGTETPPPTESATPPPEAPTETASTEEPPALTPETTTTTDTPKTDTPTTDTPTTDTPTTDTPTTDTPTTDTPTETASAEPSPEAPAVPETSGPTNVPEAVVDDTIPLDDSVRPIPRREAVEDYAAVVGKMFLAGAAGGTGAKTGVGLSLADSTVTGFLTNPKVKQLANGFDAEGEGPPIDYKSLPADKEVTTFYRFTVRYGEPSALAKDLGRSMSANHLVFVLGHFFEGDAKQLADKSQKGASKIYGPAFETFAASPSKVKYGMTFFLGCGSEFLEDLFIEYQTKQGRGGEPIFGNRGRYQYKQMDRVFGILKVAYDGGTYDDYLKTIYYEDDQGEKYARLIGNPLLTKVIPVVRAGDLDAGPQFQQPLQQP